jgi:hypothetical protein
MSLLDQIRADKLIQLAHDRFDPNPYAAELRVLHDSASSEELPDPKEDALRPEIRAEFLRWLATDSEAAPYIDPKGLRVYATTIPGKLDLEGCHVRSTLDFRRCTFQEEIKLESAETRGIYFVDSSLDKGIFADGVVVHGKVVLSRTKSGGAIHLVGTEITGVLECSGAKLTAKGLALAADRARIGSSVFLDDDFEAWGIVRLANAEIVRTLYCVGAKIAEMQCQNMQVRGDFVWQRITKSEDTQLKLVGARVKNLRDDQESWPERGKLDIDGLVYDELTLHKRQQPADIALGKFGPELPLVARERIDWIMLQPEDKPKEPQPWMQLRDLLEKKGQRREAKYVLFRFRCLQVQGLEWHPLRWAWRVLRTFLNAIQLLFLPKAWNEIWPVLRHPNRLLQTSFAWLEEAPIRICWSIGFTLALGTLVFAGASRSGAMIETVQTQPAMIASYTEIIKGAVRKPDESIKPVSIHYPSFQPFVYTLENAVPLIKLGMDDKWMPDRQHQPQPWCRFGWLDWLKWFNSYGFLVWSRWLLIASGWVQATVLAAALADRFKK